MVHSWLEKAHWDRTPTGSKDLTGFFHVFGSEDSAAIAKIIAQEALPWQVAQLKGTHKELIHFAGKKGPVWILRQRKAPGAVSHSGRLEESRYAFFRETVGALVSGFKSLGLKRLAVKVSGLDSEQLLGFCAGLEMGAYIFRDLQNARALAGLPELWIRQEKGKIDQSLIHRGRLRALAINRARHLVNLPPNELNPEAFAELVQGFKAVKGLKVDGWSGARLVKENMGLLMAVGQGAEVGPRFVHLRWRPTEKSKLRPVALVGKGITFDSGGLDLKPSSGMRLMKKDMGGAAAVVAVMRWVAESNYRGPVDAYLALAENSVDAKAFRPSDVIKARNGQYVEIDNTDAEGRLVLADALDVAVTQKGSDEPETVINVATLTGAIKVALGAEVAGLFSNDDLLADELNLAGQRSGDLNWRMPLVEKYWAGLASPFADFKNSADGFGGAITAALFLSKFVRSKRWAHLDIYAWNDKVQGGLQFSGGNGQAVQCLIEWLEQQQEPVLSADSIR